MKNIFMMLIITTSLLFSDKIENVNYRTTGGDSGPWLCFWCTTKYYTVVNNTNTVIDGDGNTVTTHTIDCSGTPAIHSCPNRPTPSLITVSGGDFFEDSIEMMNDHVEDKVYTDSIYNGNSHFNTVYLGVTYYRSVSWDYDITLDECIINHSVIEVSP